MTTHETPEGKVLVEKVRFTRCFQTHGTVFFKGEEVFVPSSWIEHIKEGNAAEILNESQVQKAVWLILFIKPCRAFGFDFRPGEQTCAYPEDVQKYISKGIAQMQQIVTEEIAVNFEAQFAKERKHARQEQARRAQDQREKAEKIKIALGLNKDNEAAYVPPKLVRKISRGCAGFNDPAFLNDN